MPRTSSDGMLAAVHGISPRGDEQEGVDVSGEGGGDTPWHGCHSP